jgi:Ca2+-binding EF-hand superfamily protein
VNHDRICQRAAAVLLTTLLSAVPVVADEKPDSPPQEPKSAPSVNEAPLSPEAQQVADDLTARLPADSEARAMLDHILSGSRLGPGEGWFALAQAQTRFGWEYVQKVYDVDSDERITADEFAGTKTDFARLDRDGDNALTAEDFDWSEDSLSPSPGLMLFFQADRDANGKITREEFADLFESLDTTSQGFLSLDELRDQFQPPSEEASAQQRARRPDRPSRSTLVLALQQQEIGSLQSGPALNEPAPDFTLTSLDGGEVTLSQEIGEQPIVLIFGNFTCGPFRSQAGNIEKLYQRYNDRAKFFLVYVREAHPKDGWWMTSNESVGIDIAQPTDNQSRREVAQTCQSHLDLDIPFLVDTVDDKVGGTYSGMPNRLYLIDKAGKIAFKNGRGPFGFHPRQLEQALVLLLNEQQTDSQ